MELLSKLNISMGAEEFANLLETLEKKDFSFWKGRIVADKDSNKYSLENLLQIFKALKETSNIEEGQLEKLRLKLIDLYTPDNTSNKIKDLFYTILAPLKGGIARNNILGIAESKWKKVARVSLVTLTGALALGGIAVVGSKLLRFPSHPHQQKDMEKISLELEKPILERKEIKEKSLGFPDLKVLGKQRDILRNRESLDMQKPKAVPVGKTVNHLNSTLEENFTYETTTLEHTDNQKDNASAGTAEAPAYLEAALTQASSLFKERSDNIRGIKILSDILEKSSLELTEETKSKVLAIFKIVSLNDEIERKEDNKDEKKVKTEAPLFLELLSLQKTKMTNEEHIILAEEYLKRNTPVMKNVAFDLLSNLLPLNHKNKSDFLTKEQEEKITHLIQQQLQYGLLPSNLESIKKILKKFNNKKKFDISENVLKDFVNNKSAIECEKLTNFMLNYIKSSDKGKFYKDLNEFANFLWTKSREDSSIITGLNKEKHSLAIKIYSFLSKNPMPHEFWKNLEKVFKMSPVQSIYCAIRNGRTIETTNGGKKEVVYYTPSNLFESSSQTWPCSR